MTDISKCAGEGCIVRDRCWRYLAPSGAYQSWTKPEGDEHDESCPLFWEVKTGGEAVEDEAVLAAVDGGRVAGV